MTRQPLGLHGVTHLPWGQDPVPDIFVGRISWGRVYNDGTLLDPGSGDWESTVDVSGMVVITFSPAFAVRPAVQVTPSDNGSPFTSPPAFGTYGNYVSLLPVTSVSADLSTLYVPFYDPDGNLSEVGFDFEAIASD